VLPQTVHSLPLFGCRWVAVALACRGLPFVPACAVCCGCWGRALSALANPAKWSTCPNLATLFAPLGVPPVWATLGTAFSPRFHALPGAAVALLAVGVRCSVVWCSGLVDLLVCSYWFVFGRKPGGKRFSLRCSARLVLQRAQRPPHVLLACRFGRISLRGGLQAPCDTPPASHTSPPGCLSVL
jgi:hypothetical protein